MNVDHEVATLVEELQRFGGRTTFGVLCRDDRCANLFEALGGTLKAAKRRKLVDYDSELLLQGAHDHVEVYLVQPAATLAAAVPSPSAVAPAGVAAAEAAPSDETSASGSAA